jgi:bifunctional N-acetylglucosamine-1-phosphate-uridyltransferase/glucosamine-1-phosphate-acetyltransferase GlmU-like protein
MSNQPTLDVAMSKTQRELASGSGFNNYKKIFFGQGTIFSFALYEFITTTLSNLPGILGFASRTVLYPILFNSCGKRPAFGRGVILRQPQRVSLKDKILIDDYVTLDVIGHGTITLGNSCLVGRHSSLVAKDGSITMGEAVNVGSYTRIATQSNIKIGDSTLISAFTYIGPGNHKKDPTDQRALIESEMEIKGGVTIGKNVWIGTHVTIMDGVTIGDNAVIGAHSLVKNDVPENCTAFGVPARVVTTNN